MTKIQSELSKRKEPLLVKTHIELYRLIDYFKKENKKNSFQLLLWDLENVTLGLLLQQNLQLLPKILSAEILKIKTKYTHYELSFVESKIVKQPMLK